MSSEAAAAPSDSLFPPKPKYACQRLDEGGWRSSFRKLWPTLTQRYFMFEGRQAYAQPGDPSYEAFIRGDLAEAARQLASAIAAQEGLYSALFRKGVDFVRVRAVELPLSPYLRDYEFPAYRISSQYGERILILRLSETEPSSQFFAASDFLLFDSSAALVHDYDPTGLLRGGWLCRNAEYCAQLYALSRELVSASVPFRTFERSIGL